VDIQESGGQYAIAGQLMAQSLGLISQVGAEYVFYMNNLAPTRKGQIRGFKIGPMSLENKPVVQRNKQKDFGFSGMFNYEVIQDSLHLTRI
jgi:hypothetical protein